jgi:hypothetical protein
VNTPPSVGRTVHYRSYGTPGGEYSSACRAAIVTEVGAWVDVPGTVTEQDMDGERFRTVTQVWKDDAALLNVLNPTGAFFNTCEHAEDPKVGGTWHWPERV